MGHNAYPNSVWDGSSPTRDAALGIRREADKSDYDQIVSEIAAIQTYLGAQGAVSGRIPANGSGLEIDRNSLAKYQSTHIKLTDAIVPLADGPPGPAYGSKLIWEFGSTPVITQAAGVSLTITKSSAGVDADWDGDISMGTAPANGADGLTATEADIFTSIVTPQAVLGVTSVGNLELNSDRFSGSTGPHKVYLNLIVDLNDHSVPTPPCNLILNGFVILLWLPVEV
jgi:hypothetical protein